ncbi:MAG: GTPase ObgE [Spirochaetes bacterium]|nr:MAG: GTPase ObgE [Spirochaetota bacterium]
MAKFTDTISIHVKAGKGGQGAISFYREKYIPKGGPDGGDGGRGGDLYLEASNSYYNLSHLFRDRVYQAESGRQGMGANKHGRDGHDLTIKLPPGTEVLDEDGELICDLTNDGQRFLIAQGGIGGKGNAFFKTSTHQAPRFAQPGMPGEEKHIVLNLKLIADVGLVGLPNAGKSTLLAKITNAKPKIADYPFTTLIPNLGVVQRADTTSYRIADIPGIIEGAHKGLGLGLSFLQHIERVRVMLFLVDVTGEDLIYTLHLLREELKTYNEELTSRPSAVLLTKTDLMDDETLQKIIDQFPGETIVPLSAHSGHNLELLMRTIDTLLG